MIRVLTCAMIVLMIMSPMHAQQAQVVERQSVPGEFVFSVKSPSENVDVRVLIESWSLESVFPDLDVYWHKTMLQWQRPSESLYTVVVHCRYTGDVEPEAVGKLLETRSGLEWAYPNIACSGDVYDYVPNDPSYGNQYHHPLMNNPAAWDTTLGSSAIIMGITDDGVQLNHPDLDANIWVNSGEIANDGIDNDMNGYVDDVNGWDFSSGDNDPNPVTNGDDHGTHVAGICGGVTDNGIGISGTAGGATIMPLRFYGSGSWTATKIANTFAYAADNGAMIVNTSYNIDGWVGNPVFTAGLQYYYDQGGLHFNSAGNGSALNPPRQAFHQTLLTVNTNGSDVKSSSSNWGTGVDVCAPGSSIYSTVTNSGYGTKSGTSMAAPNAAGAAALIWSAHPTWTREQVAAQLLATADNIDSLNPGLEGLLGAGRVNTGNALTTTIPPPRINLELGLPAEDSTINVPDAFAFTLGFDQIMEPASINDPDAFTLIAAGPDTTFDTGDDTFVALSWTEYLIGTNRLHFEIDSGTLCDGRYRIVADAGILSNPFGAALDGNADGTGGDSWTRTFFIQPTELTPLEPLGSLVAAALRQPLSFQDSGEVRTVCFAGKAGSLLTAIVEPAGSAMLSAFLTTNSGTPLGDTISAVLPGDIIQLDPSLLDQTSTYLLHVSSTTAGQARVDLIQNAVAEGNDSSDGDERAIDSSWVALGSGRFALIGNVPAQGFQFNSGNDPTRFVDISASGTGLGLSDDGEATITSTVGNTLFPAGALTIGNNGAIIAAPGENLHYTNDTIPSGEFTTALLPFWDDIDSEDGDVYWEEVTINGIPALVVQWHERPHYNNIGNVTFQLQLFASGPVLARFAYDDVDFGNTTYDFGASATIGYQLQDTITGMYSFNTAVLANGDYIDIVANDSTDVDEYTVDLTAFNGSPVDVVLKGQDVDMSSDALELLDVDGTTVLATGSSDPVTPGTDAANYDLGILDYTIPAGGVYTLRVTSQTPGDYVIVLAEGLAFDTEPNDTAGTRMLSDSLGALGALTGSDTVDLYALILSPYDTVHLRTTTPDPAPLVLDPRLTLYRDSSGLIQVAQDDNSAPDGRNAFIQYGTATGGIHWLAVERISGAGAYTVKVEIANCPKHLVLTAAESPLAGSYHAFQSIRLMADAELEMNTNIDLYAQSVIIDSLFSIPVGNHVEVHEIGCDFFEEP